MPSLEEDFLNIAIDADWSPATVVMYLADFIGERDLGGEAKAFLRERFYRQQEQLGRDRTETLNEDFLADQADQDFMQSYEP